MGLLDFLRGGRTKVGKEPEIRDKDPFIFISYALANADEVFGIVKQFRDRGYHVWCDEGIAFGDEKTDTSANALELAALFLVFLSPESQALVKIRHEINCALNAGKPFLAVYLKETNLTADLQLRLAAQQAIRKYDMSEEEFFDQCSFAFERLGLFETPAIQNPTIESSDLTRSSSHREENPDRVKDCDKGVAPHYDKAGREHMRRLLQKASPVIDLIAEDLVPWGSPASAELVDSLAAAIGLEKKKQKDDKDDVELQELRDDRVVLINLYAALKKESTFVPLYVELGNLLRKYGLFYEEIVLLKNAISDCDFSDADLAHIENRLSVAERYQDADDAAMTDTERIAEDLRRAVLQKPLDVSQIKELLDQCTDDGVLYDIACDADKDPDMIPIREKAACLIRSREYQYALSSHVLNPARTAMILNLYDSLKGDELFIARTILTDPNDVNKAHMLLFCEDENLLMLGWLYVYGERRFCTERLHALGSDYPEAYLEADPGKKAKLEQEWIDAAAQTALEVLTEDNEVRERTAGAASVDSEPLHFFLSIRHPRKAVRWWHVRKLENPVYIAYVGSWTSDDQIKEALSVKINSTTLITEMIFGDLSGADLIFTFRKPKDMTLQDRFCIEIMRNHPDRTIREHVRKELLRGNVEIPGADLSKPDPLYKDK